MSFTTELELGLVFTVMLWSSRLLSVFVLICSLLPLIRSGWWVIRACDFPRLQIFYLCTFALLITLFVAACYRWSDEATATTTILVCILMWQGWHIIRYTPLWPKNVSGSSESQLRILIANVDFKNTAFLSAAQMIQDADPNVLLLIEINERWREGLAEIRERFTYRVEDIRDNGLGLALWSSVPITDARIEYLVSDDRPSIYTSLDVDGQSIRLVGVHPTPPGLPRRGEEGRHDSRIRDAELLLVASRVGEDTDSSWIIAGDFNDVAWSRTTRLFKEISGLKELRVGRGFFSTYHARYPLLRYPLDHVFVSPGTRVQTLCRVKLEGSDHFAMLAKLDLRKAVASTSPDATIEEQREASELIVTGTKDAAEQGNAPQ